MQNQFDAIELSSHVLNGELNNNQVGLNFLYTSISCPERLSVYLRDSCVKTFLICKVLSYIEASIPGEA